MGKRYVSMKPKNRVFCPDCNRHKMLFETEKEANTFLKFNMDEINPDGTRNMRVYYCPACCGYHITSHEYNGVNRTEKLIEAYHKEVGGKPYYDEITSGELFDELKSRKFTTKQEVNLYLKNKTDVTQSAKDRAREKYYRYVGITKTK